MRGLIKNCKIKKKMSMTSYVLKKGEWLYQFFVWADKQWVTIYAEVSKKIHI